MPARYLLPAAGCSPPEQPAQDVSSQPGQLLKKVANTGNWGPVRPFTSLKMSLTTPPAAWMASTHAWLDVGGFESQIPVAAQTEQWRVYDVRSVSERPDA